MREQEIRSIFDEYETNQLCISDWGILYRETLIDYVALDDERKIHLWAGNMDEDKYAEELLPDKNELKTIYDLILEYFN